MMRLLRLSLLATAGLSVAAIAAPEHERLRGTVSAVSANELTMRTATGDVSLSLGGDTKYLTVSRSDLDHITPDSYVGVATKNVGDKLVALDVLIFPPAMKGAAEGHFGWDRLPDTTLAGGARTASSMTNGSVAAAAFQGDARQGGRGTRRHFNRLGDVTPRRPSRPGGILSPAHFRGETKNSMATGARIEGTDLTRTPAPNR